MTGDVPKLANSYGFLDSLHETATESLRIGMKTIQAADGAIHCDLELWVISLAKSGSPMASPRRFPNLLQLEPMAG
jgi:hypothetical protein